MASKSKKTGAKGQKESSAAPSLLVQRVEIGSITPDPANLRKHDQRSIDAIAASLHRFGQQKPIVLDAAGVCRAGNGTLAAAKSIGWTHLDAVRTSLSGSELTAYAIADNRTADLSEFDEPSLGRVLESLDEEGVDLAAMGFEEKELQKLLKQTEDAEPDQSPPEDPPSKFMVLLICKDEDEQRQLLEQFTAEGRECRAMVA